MASPPTASWFEYLDLADLTEPLLPNKGKVVPREPGLGLEWDEKAVHKYAFERRWLRIAIPGRKRLLPTTCLGYP